MIGIFDNWYDDRHKDENLLKHFPDKDLQDELDRRQAERRKIEIMQIVGSRDPVGFFDLEVVHGNTTEWELNIVFSNATKHRFNFSNKVGQEAKTRDDFRMLYFPHLTRLDYDDYHRMVEAKAKLRKKKKKICHGP